jgi:hypothetical protein
MLYADSKQHEYRYGPREVHILRQARFIQLPKNYFPYLSVDIDIPGSAYDWSDQGLPIPTISMVSPDTAHALLMWELTNPVTLPREQFDGVTNLKPFDYFKAIKKAYTRALDGDPAYAGRSVKNPFYANLSGRTIPCADGIIYDVYKTTWFNRTYSLAELAKFVELEHKRYQPENLYDPSSRLKSMFNYSAHDSYAAVHNYSTEEEFRSVVTEIVMGYWHEFKQESKDHPLTEAEAERCIRDITRWTWQRRHQKWLKRFTYEIGVMDYDPINRDELSDEEIAVEIANRKSAAAKRTHEKRKEKTIKSIENACRKLKCQNKKLTHKNIAGESGLSVKTIRRYCNRVELIKATILHNQYK